MRKNLLTWGLALLSLTLLTNSIEAADLAQPPVRRTKKVAVEKDAFPRQFSGFTLGVTTEAQFLKRAGKDAKATLRKVKSHKPNAQELNQYDLPCKDVQFEKWKPNRIAFIFFRGRLLRVEYWYKDDYDIDSEAWELYESFRHKYSQWAVSVSSPSDREFGEDFFLDVWKTEKTWLNLHMRRYDWSEQRQEYPLKVIFVDAALNDELEYAERDTPIT